MNQSKNRRPRHRLLAIASVATLLAAAGCASSTRSALSGAAHVTTSTTGATETTTHGEIPSTAYLSVVQNYILDGGAPAGPGSQLRYGVTDKKVIAQLADLINGLPVAPDQGVTPCPSSMAPAFGLDFKDQSNAAPAAEVDIECFGVMVMLHGQRKPILSTAQVGKNQLLQKVNALLAGSRPRN